MTDLDLYLQRRLKRLHALSSYLRWLAVLGAWLLMAPIALWALRDEIGLWRDYFTWAAVRYGLASHRLPALGLFFCLGITVSTLLWQGYHSLRGISPQERTRLENQLRQIEKLKPEHPLRKWLSKF
jgi:hypothetical protein